MARTGSAAFPKNTDLLYLLARKQNLNQGFTGAGAIHPLRRSVRVPEERRRYKRFEMMRECKLTLIRDTGRGREEEDCTLLNLCYGGMCFRTRRPMQRDEEYQFLIDLPTPVRGSVFVKARICWARSAEYNYSDIGAIFVESSRGWLGPEETEQFAPPQSLPD